MSSLIRVIKRCANVPFMIIRVIPTSNDADAFLHQSKINGSPSTSANLLSVPNHYRRPPAMLAAGHSVLPPSFRFFFFNRLISEIPWPIVTKLCHVVGGHPDLQNSVRNLDGPFSPKFGGPKTSTFRRDFAQLSELIANSSGTQQDIVNRKTAFSCKLRTIPHRQT